MAAIYTILGTDSISSSRLNINENFNLLNTELSSILGFFTPASQNLLLTGTLTIGGVTSISGALTATAGLTVTGAISASVGIINSGKVIKSGIVASSATLPGANLFSKSTYQVNCSGTEATPLTTDALEDGDQGQEILIVCGATQTTGTAFKITPSDCNIKNVTASITLVAGDDTKDYVLLRYVTDKWIIISIGSGVTVV